MTEETDQTNFFNSISFIDGLLNEIADRVIKKLTDSSSNMLNTIQYKVRAENIEGQIKATQIDGLDDMVEDAVSSTVKDMAREAGADAAEKYVRNLEFVVVR
jgi:hypothetical protein